MSHAVIVAASRSPIGRARKGSLKDLRADDLAATIVRSALEQVPQLDPNSIDELLLGCAQPAGEQGYGLGRVVATLLGLDGVPAATVQRYCASSLQTTRMADQAIRCGDGDVYVSAGVEAVSRFARGKSDGLPDTHNPVFAAAQRRTADLIAAGSAWTDPRSAGELPDAYIAMGHTAEHVARLHGVSRADQDAWALLSQQRAEKSAADGFWKQDITPVALPDGTVVDTDDCPRPGTTAEGLAALEPVFHPEGTVTAGNCCPLNDGAAAVVVMSETRAAELGITPLARILSTAVSAVSPEIMGITPVEASRRALARAGLTMGDVDLVEMNEAFAAQVVASRRALDIDEDKLNVHGGAIAVGHPFGMTGARITTTLLNALRHGDKEIGLEAMCAAGGQGMAMVVQRLS
ncbi:acetyl-CoA C-acetyltransferase [Streptomyces thermolineatus]|uniref:Acetyl-CoA C-acetyltransferase n=1 Tax=Streptomyces thermolineatus TaxID=44033 RepID=A0ABP5YLW2_9ACTN